MSLGLRLVAREHGGGITPGREHCLFRGRCTGDRRRSPAGIEWEETSHRQLRIQNGTSEEGPRLEIQVRQ